MNNVVLEIGVIMLLLVANGLFAMTEIAVISSRKSRLKKLADEGRAKARAALELAESPNRFLSTVQVGITLVGILAGAFGGATLAEQLAAALTHLGLTPHWAEAAALAVVVAVIAYFSLVIGELVPKRLALSNPEGIAMAMAGPMRRIAALANPAVKLLSGSTELALKALGLGTPAQSTVSEEEVRLLVREGQRSGTLLPAESAMVERVLALDSLPVKNVMTPRPKIIFINLNDPHETLWHKIVVSGHSNFPVYEGTRDNVVGVIAVKSIYANLAAGVPVNVKDLITPPLLVPATMPVLALVEAFKKAGRYMALAADEFGGIVGMVTLHDVMEAIAGDMPSPNERLKPTAKRREDGSWLVDAMIEVADFERLVPEFKLPPPSERDYQTLAGYVVRSLGRVPTEGESFQASGFQVEVIDMDRFRVDKVLLIPLKKNGSAT